MPRVKHTAEQAIPRLREAEVAIATGKTVAAACKQIGVTEQDVLPLAEGVRRAEDGPGQAAQGPGAGERPTETPPGGGGAGQGDPQGGRLGKLLSPARRRRAVGHVRAVLGPERVSERRACRVLGQSRSTQRRAAHVPDDEPALVKRLVELATTHGRYGYRRTGELLRREGWRVNHKRVERLWRPEGLKVPKRQPKRRRLWLNDGSCVRLRPGRKDHVWSYDFVQERTHDGRAFRMLTVIDEHTRECLAIDVARRLPSEDVLERLSGLFVRRGVPGHLRSDNGPEFTARAVRDWLGRVGVRTLFIEPGSPWENGYCESFNGKLRDELLAREAFDTLPEAKVPIERWRVEYNEVRPHSSLGYRPPAPEAVDPADAVATAML